MLMSNPQRLTAGSVAVRRYFRGPHLNMAQATRVVQRSAEGLLLWVPVGAGFATRYHADGTAMREEPIEVVGQGRLAVSAWRERDVLMLVRPGRSHSVWWFFDRGRFDGWYVNLEQPPTFWDDGTTTGFDTIDHSLDLLVAPDRTTAWKDEDEFRWATGQPGYWSAEFGRTVLAEGWRLRRLAAAKQFPFDGTWCDIRVDSPPPPRLEGDAWRERPAAWTLRAAA
jgi:hypothetical protein